MKVKGNNNELIRDLVTIPVFSALNEDQLEKVLASAEQVNLSNGNFLFEQGQIADWFYMVQEGQIQLSRLSEYGDEKVIDILHPGQIFAEAVMFMDHQRYPVNALAMKDSQLFAFHNETFRSILKDSVDTCFRLMADMSQRLHIQLNEIDSLSQHNATYRLIHFLLKSAPENAATNAEIKLSYPKNIIASRLSIKPETFSRIMAQLKQKNIIEVRGSQIIIPDISRLRNLVGD